VSNTPTLADVTHAAKETLTRERLRQQRQAHERYMFVQGHVFYRLLPEGDASPWEVALAQRVIGEACADLGIPVPVVRWFTDASREEVRLVCERAGRTLSPGDGFLWSATPFSGLATADTHVYLRARMSERDLVFVCRHESRHLWQWRHMRWASRAEHEADADRWAWSQP